MIWMMIDYIRNIQDMTKYSVSRRFAILIWPVFLLCVSACSMANLDLCVDGHPHRGQLIVSYDWSGIKDELPDSMVVLAIRPVFRDKVSSNWSSRVNSGERRPFGRFIASATGEDSLYYAPLYRSHGGGVVQKDGVEDEGVSDVMMSRDSIFLTSGEWNLLSFSSNPAVVEVTKGYTADVWDESKALDYRLKVYEQLPDEYKYWYDRNPYGGWVDASEKSAVCMARGSVVVDDMANVKKSYTVKLKPSIISQKINIAFDAEIVDADIVVDKIVCAVSGVTGMIELDKMRLNPGITHQAIFETELTKISATRIRANGTIYVPGLMRSSDSSLLQGPGVLSASVFVSYTDDEGVRRERRLDATLNLFRVLTATPSLKSDRDGYMLQTASTVNLHIDSRMLISKKRLSSAQDALDAWVDETIIDVEI